MLLTTVVKGHTVGPMQRTCFQSIALASDVPMRQEQWRDVWDRAWVRNQGRRTTQHTPHHEMLAEDGSDVGRCQHNPFHRQKVETRLERKL